jgi:hypothetical protein
MRVVSDVGGEVSSRRSDDLRDFREPMTRGRIVAFSLAIAVCVIMVASIVAVLVIQPGNKPASNNLCWDSAMQMDMPCSSRP